MFGFGVETVWPVLPFGVALVRDLVAAMREAPGEAKTETWIVGAIVPPSRPESTKNRLRHCDPTPLTFIFSP